MSKGISRICLLLSSIFLFSATQARATDVTVGPETTVVTTGQIIPDINPFSGQPTHAIDAPLTTYVSGGVRYWLNSLGSVHMKYKGTLDAPFQTQVWTKDTKTLFSDPYHLGLGGPWRKIDAKNFTFDGSAVWVVNVYQPSDKEILAFLHIEIPALVNGVYTTGKSKIGLAWSKNGGESFTYIGDIVTYSGTASEYNMQGAPYIIKDGYFYLYYHDMCPGQETSVARADVATVIAAAKNGQVTTWSKYDKSGWTNTGLGGVCSAIKITPGIDHTDAAYSSYTGKYYLLLSQYGASTVPTWIKLFESTDGISWTYLTDIVSAPTAKSGGYQYVTIVNADGTDNGVVGKSFYVYSAKNLSAPTVSRWLVTFKTPATAKVGDLNGDNVVNALDYNILLADFGKTGTVGFTPADINKDGKVNILDYNLLSANYGK